MDWVPILLGAAILIGCILLLGGAIQAWRHVDRSVGEPAGKRPLGLRGRRLDRPGRI